MIEGGETRRLITLDSFPHTTTAFLLSARLLPFVFFPSSFEMVMTLFALLALLSFLSSLDLASSRAALELLDSTAHTKSELR